MVYTAVYNYKLYFIIIRMIYCVFLPPVTDRMREVSVRDCRGRSDTRVSPVTCAERYGY
ncbi:unknown [Alistipes sp. CAG:157]|nr:unknown [Alistipes sp. CAG:157]